MKIHSLILVSGLFLTACSSSDTSFLDDAKQQGAQNTKVVKDWEKGQEMLEDGQDLVRKGKNNIKEGRSLIDDGQDQQEEGQRLIQQADRIKHQAEDEFRQMKHRTTTMPSGYGNIDDYQTMPYYPAD